jgi:hypothetical protein
MPALRPSRPLLLGLPLALLALAGCASPPGGDAVPPPPAEPPVEASAPSYACPPRGQPSEGGMCLASIDTRLQTGPTALGLQAAPGRPGAWVLLAYTWPDGPDASEPQRQLARPGADYSRSFLYVTEDEGQSWERRLLPVLDVGSSATSGFVRVSSTLATTMAWDGAGRLHVAGYAEAQAEEGLCECPPAMTSESWAFHAVTADLGRTWEARALGEWDETLRPRLGHRPGLMALAYGSADGAEVFASRDDGATWLPVDGHPDCNAGSLHLTDHRFVALGDDLLFRCAGQGVSSFHRIADSPNGTALFLEDGPLEADPEREEPTDCATVLLRAWRGRAVLVGAECPDLRMWVRGGDGAWAPTLLLASEPAPGFAERTTVLRGAHVAGDVLHLLLAETDRGGGDGLTDVRNALVHRAFGMDGSPLGEWRMRVPGLAEPDFALSLLDSLPVDPLASVDGRTMLLLPRDGISYTYIE